MSKHFLNILFGGLVLLIISSCQENNLVVDKDVVPPAYAKFNVIKPADTIATYYIRNGGAPFKIPVGLTNVSDKPRTIQFSYTSTAAAGVQYSAPTTLVIPAGQALDSLSVQGLFAGYPLASRRDTLIIRISGGDVPASPYWSTFRLIMRKYCDVSLAAFAGNYNNAIDNGNYGPYPMAITPGSSSGTTGTITVSNLWDPGVPVTTTVTLDWTDPANFKMTIPDQVYFGAANWWIQGTSTGTFSSCDQTFTFRYRLYNKVTGAILYNNQVTVLSR